MKVNKSVQKKVLMVALDFPPCQSPGVQRTKSFYENLSYFDWEAIVLTAYANIYDRVEHENDYNKNVYRAFGLNTTKHLSVKGKYFGFTALPDRYWTWYWHAMYLGRKIIQKEKPNIIWATFPCSTALKIATRLSEEFDIPMVVDFRDPFVGHYRLDSIGYSQKYNIDKSAVERAEGLVFCTPNMLDLYDRSYQVRNEKKTYTITNGYSEKDFISADSKLNIPKPTVDKKEYTALLHSGGLYEDGRNPIQFIRAFERFSKENNIGECEVIFRGAEPFEELIYEMESLTVRDRIHFEKSIPYIDSLVEMLDCEVLLLIQDEVFNNQVPGKAYDYLRSGRAILALTPEDGATYKILSEHAGVVCANPDNTDEIYAALIEIFKYSSKRFKRDVQAYERKALSGKLALALNEIIASG